MQLFSCKYWECFKNTYFEEHLETAASVSYVLLLSEPFRVKLSYHFILPKYTYHEYKKSTASDAGFKENREFFKFFSNLSNRAK